MKRLLPGRIYEMLRGCRGGKRPTPRVWEGVYAQYRDVPVSGPGLTGETWLAAYRRNVIRLCEDYASKGACAPSAYGEHHMLCLVAAVIGRGRPDLRVLDFGGGMGAGFVHLANSGQASTLHYQIVDTPEMCTEGRRLFTDDLRIQFSLALSEVEPPVDVVYVNSVLQYIEDYPALILSLCALRPTYFLFVRLSAGDNPRYATAQKNLPDSIVPYWFLNVQELCDMLHAADYRLLYRGLTPWTEAQSNFPPEYRIPGTVNLLFADCRRAV